MVSYNVSVLRDLETPQLSLAACTLGFTVTSNNNTAMAAPALLTNSIETPRPRHLSAMCGAQANELAGWQAAAMNAGTSPCLRLITTHPFSTRIWFVRSGIQKAYWLVKCVTMCTGLWHFQTWEEGKQLQFSQLVSDPLYSQAECLSSSGAQPLRNNTCLCS